MRIQQLILRGLMAFVAAALVSACGGGGGDGASAPTLQRPPASPATLAPSTADAQAAVQAAVAGSATVISQAAGLDSSLFLFGNPLGGASSPLNLATRVLAAARERAAAVQTVTCADLFGTPACSGSVTVDSNAPATAAVWPAGTYVAMTFNALAGSFNGRPFSINGQVRIDVLTPFDTNATTFANVSIQITATNLSGTSTGVSFGPENSVALIEIDAAGNGALIADGVRISGLDGLNVTDADNFSLSGVGLRSRHWADAAAYIDTRFTRWIVSAGRAQTASSLVISAGNAGVAIAVGSSTRATVVYDVSFTVGAVVTRYNVTASYPAGGGAPTYTVQPG